MTATNVVSAIGCGLCASLRAGGGPGPQVPVHEAHGLGDGGDAGVENGPGLAHRSGIGAGQ